MLLGCWPGIEMLINLWCQILKDTVVGFGALRLAVAGDPSRATEVSTIMWTRCVAMFVMMELQYWLLISGMHHSWSIINIFIRISSFWYKNTSKNFENVVRIMYLYQSCSLAHWIRKPDQCNLYCNVIWCISRIQLLIYSNTSENFSTLKI
jgi:hypothetical protein